MRYLIALIILALSSVVYAEQAITVNKEEATIISEKNIPGAFLDGEIYRKVNKGYEKWAYVYKKIIPDTQEEIEAKRQKAVCEGKVKNKMRKIAIMELIKEGELPEGYQ